MSLRDVILENQVPWQEEKDKVDMEW